MKGVNVTELYKRGDRVKHKTRTDWGLGEVLDEQVGDKIQVIFEDADPNLKTFAVSVAPFIKVTWEECRSEYLSGLVKRHLRQGHSKAGAPIGAVPSFDLAVQKFLRFFPAGFHDAKYQADERDYKFKAHGLMLGLLGRDQMLALMGSRRYEEIWRRARKLVDQKTTNLINLYEILWLRSGVNSPSRQQLFSTALDNLLWSEDAMAKCFESFAQMLYAIGAAKWLVATYFLFLAFPDNQIFPKPEVTKLAAKICRADIQYVLEVNWTTYAKVLLLTEEIKARLIQRRQENLIPRDMIDVQSFIWVIGAYPN
jgi:hypothetical protein